jgi:hypothetical protein
MDSSPPASAESVDFFFSIRFYYTLFARSKLQETKDGIMPPIIIVVRNTMINTVPLII